MKLHANAQTCPLLLSNRFKGDERREASISGSGFQVSTKTIFKWVARFRAEGSVGLGDRTSRPHRIARRHLQVAGRGDPNTALNSRVEYASWISIDEIRAMAATSSSSWTRSESWRLTAHGSTRLHSMSQTSNHFLIPVKIG
jgi:hypothetical protein